MATNVFFNNFQSSQEQLLIENLIIESIKIYGHDVYYLPKTLVAKDTIYNEDTLSEFKSAHFIDMYIKNVDGFAGDGDFISKFGLEIKDRVTFSVARRTFNDDVGSEIEINRPREGDLIYFPLNRKVFEIKFVEHEAIFYQLGALQMYDIICELYEYSNEKFETGIADIDNLFIDLDESGVMISTALSNFALQTEDSNPYDILDESGYLLVDEQFESFLEDGDGSEIQEESDQFIDFSEIDPFAERAY
jgi:hypothetical protein